MRQLEICFLDYGNRSKEHSNPHKPEGIRAQLHALAKAANSQYKTEFTIRSKCFICKAYKITLFIIADESKKGIILGSKQNCLYDSLYCSMILST